MKQLHHRLVIYPKDVILITGRSERSARRMLQAIRKKTRKKKDAFISLEEFCAYTGLKEEEVMEFLK